jgi:hypothetical protein
MLVWSSKQPFEKNFYVEHPAVAARSMEEVAAYRRAREIHVEGQHVPKPVTTFDEASFPGAPAACTLTRARQLQSLANKWMQRRRGCLFRPHACP